MTNHPTTREWKLTDAEPVIGNGWIALYRSRGYIASLIQFGTGGPYSHAAMLRKINGHVDVLEMREGYGGRCVTLFSEVYRYHGLIDVYSVDTRRWPEYQGKNATDVMRHFTGRDYGWLGVLRLALQRVPLLWRLWPIDLDDKPDDCLGAPFCSQAVSFASRVGGGVDPVPRKPDERVTPNDLSWSLLYKYEGTLVI